MKRVLLFVLAFVCISLHTYAQVDFSAKVVNKVNEPLAGATVILDGTYWKTVTDSKGIFLFKNLPAGNYRVKITYLGYLELVNEVSLVNSKNMIFTLQEKSILTEEITIKGVRAYSNQPASYTLIDKDELNKRDYGQDVPYLLALEPSVVTTSDGGTGIGYTSMRIRGLDSKKINVTINGIPYNDAESHGVYWVDIPDIASSVRSIQIQRGLGKTGNGPGSFGGSINIETNQIPLKAYFLTENTLGSFKTIKNSIQAGTGLIKNHWFAEGRYSRIGSDGYIDRASSKLRSYFAQGGYYSDKTILRLIAFGGFEETYQAWWGIDDWTMNNLGRTYNYAGYYTDKNGMENFYHNQVDHYVQNHFQLNLSHRFNDKLQFNSVLNYTTGKGYYEEFYNDALLSNYFINDVINGTDTIRNSDLAGRKWLDNKLFASNTFINADLGFMGLTFGIGLSKYFDGKHYGEIIWSELPEANIQGNSLYRNVGSKLDMNSYMKVNFEISKNLSLYLDLNYRMINYTATGVDREFGDLLNLNIDKNFHFINPLLGLSYTLGNSAIIYATLGMSHREPTRADYISNYTVPGGPKAESMINTEIGIRKTTGNYFYEANLYLMNYRNELIKTGQIDDVGIPVVKNAGKSYRMGIELNGGARISSLFSMKANLALSQNKTDFSDFVNSVYVTYNNVDISYTPNLVLGSQLIFTPLKSFEIGLLSKYVGKQYLDNTENEERILKNYFLNDLRMSYKFSLFDSNYIELKCLVNNLLNVKYSSNGYMYGDTPYYYPQATRHFLFGLTIGL